MVVPVQVLGTDESHLHDRGTAPIITSAELATPQVGTKAYPEGDKSLQMDPNMAELDAFLMFQPH